MSIYSYGITGTRHLDGFGDVSTFKFRFSRSWADEARIARQERADKRYLARWAGRKFSRLCIHRGALYVWTSDNAIGDECIESLRGNVLKYLSTEEVYALPAWVVFAIGAVDRGEIPFIPASRTEYRLLSDAYTTLRLRQRGDHNAQPLIPNNTWWDKLLKSDHPLHQTINA